MAEMIIHADDFGISLEQSKKIIARSTKCGGQGALNSTSALTTSEAFFECADWVKPFVDSGSIKMGIHINLVEGQALCSSKDIPLLVDNDRTFRHSFASILMVSKKNRQELTRQVKNEVSSQIKTFLQAFPELQNNLRIDSHQHFHLIPAVFEGVLGAVEETEVQLEYLRIPAEPIKPYLNCPNTRTHIPPINLVKNALLNWLWQKDKALYPSYLQKPAAFFGLALSGCMQYASDPLFIEEVKKYASNNNVSQIEILFHPGGLSNISDCPNPNLKDFYSFYLSENRNCEAKAISALEDILANSSY